MKIPDDLLPGDIVGYRGQAIVRWKTSGLAGHVVVYIGNGQCVTAQTVGGVNTYSLASQGDLVWVRRPKSVVNIAAGLKWFRTVQGNPYGWPDIMADSGFDVKGDNGAMDCSHTSAEFLENSGAPQFDPVFNKIRITPEHFETSFESTLIYSVA